MWHTLMLRLSSCSLKQAKLHWIQCWVRSPMTARQLTRFWNRATEIYNNNSASFCEVHTLWINQKVRRKKTTPPICKGKLRSFLFLSLFFFFCLCIYRSIFCSFSTYKSLCRHAGCSFGEVAHAGEPCGYYEGQAKDGVDRAGPPPDSTVRSPNHKTFRNGWPGPGPGPGGRKSG